MVSHKQLREIATSPHAYAQFAMNGRLPEVARPASPLICLLEALSPRDRISIVGLTVNGALGYVGSRVFHTAEQALRWLKPDTEMLMAKSWPAESYRDKSFIGPILLDQVLANAARHPETLLARYWRLSARQTVKSKGTNPGESTQGDSNVDEDSNDPGSRQA